MNIDFNSQNPETIIADMRKAAQKLREDAAELVDMWQDPNAGKVWDILAHGLDKVADQTEKYWQSI